MLKRLFCLGPSGHETDAEWVVSNAQYHPSQGMYSAGKVLDIVEDEIEERYTAVDGKKRVALGPGSMRRLHRANLPIEDSHRATELLAKVTAIDNARVASEKDRARMAHELAAAREEKRLAEFAQARAEQLAIARGEALYRCQERLTEAESQQVQLAEVLKVTLDKLGMGLTPSPAPALRGGDRSPAQLADRPAGPLFALPQLPEDAEAASPSHPDTPLSGFTVYSNELSDSPDAAWQAHAADAADDGGDSATKWRDISEVAATCPSPVAATPTPLGAASSAAGSDPDAAAERLAQLIIPHLGAHQLESLARMGASMASPVLSSPIMQRHVVAAMQRARAETRQQQRASAADAPAPPAPAPAPSAGPLSQAAGWSSPGLHGASHHITTTFDPGASASVAAAGEGQKFYGPFGAAAAASVAASQDSMASQGQERRQAPAQPPRKSTFRMMDKATGAVGERPLPPLPAASARGSADGDKIRAVMPEGRGPVVAEEGIPMDDKFARQRRAAERLAQKLNSKLPPELRCSDPLNMHAPQVVAPQARPASSATSSGGSSSGRRAPKGSLRRRAEQAAVVEVSSFNAAAAPGYRVVA